VDGVPEQALLLVEAVDVFARSAAVDAEIAGVLDRPRLARAIPCERYELILTVLHSETVRFASAERVTDCRDPKDIRYLELALAAGVETIVSRDDELPALHRWKGVRMLCPADYLSFTHPGI
jgi:predicted nucleic acid-binding protein